MKTFKKIWGVISTALVCAVVLMAVALVGVRLFGLTPLTVLSGSMEPTYHVGALIYVKNIAPENITVGMPITFVVNEDLVVATHRVVKVDRYDTETQPVLDDAGNPVPDENGEPLLEEILLEEPVFYYTTKGDANAAEDGTPVYYKNVVGTPVFTLPYLGYLASWLQTRKGMMLGGSIALALMLVVFAPDIIEVLTDDFEKGKKKKRRKKKKKKKEAE